MGRTQLPLTTIALAIGLNVRVGMEDNVYYRRGELVEANAPLVERAVRIARELERDRPRPRRHVRSWACVDGARALPRPVDAAGTGRAQAV